ncbi:MULTISPECIES: maltose alpha-D-glucosyltransferase [Luteibacter]|uniref:maltose alpha-D-glucosyltransferase n=1 Tax=Luteibacter TaxID=242605 RepID=UPI0005668E87|nr:MULTISPECIES: maltose alpha-D-glucosyltransferase [unclassified Luteibacter]
MTDETQDYVAWLLERSMLMKARERARLYGGQSRLWAFPYAESRGRSASEMASVWFTAYPASLVTRPGQSVLAALGQHDLWHALSVLGVQGMHVGPTKEAGGLRGREKTPTIDGHFDRIGLDTDEEFGTSAEFSDISRMASVFSGIVIDDVIPSHTGKGADFRLAEMAYGDFPGLYHMVEIREDDWSLLPDVLEGRDSVNLGPLVVDALHEKGYIVGQLQRVIFLEPGVKDTDWSATAPVTGVDGKVRRWVYLHYFKEGQPALNWLDPSFAAQQLVIGDALHSLDVMGARGLRLDANGFLGIERRAGGPAWSESHPLSITGNQIIAGMVRKAGGFSFQELNLTVDDIAAMSRGGADLSYDFITRPAVQHALATGDTEFLRLMLRSVHQHGIDPASLIHAMQNHDEMTLELVHFWTTHATTPFFFKGQTMPGAMLREQIREIMYERLSGEHAPYNLRFVTNGIACTTASLAAAVLGLRDMDALTEDDIEQIRKLHLLLVMFNALQPGVFAISGWDIVGALTLPPDEVASLMADGDTRWINRGAYDLMDLDPEATASSQGLPRARALYGSLREQLEQHDSFASRVRRILTVRQATGLPGGHQRPIPDVIAPGLLVMLHDLPAGRGVQITALNFSAEPIDEQLILENVSAGPVVDLLNETLEGDVGEDGVLQIHLDPYEGLCMKVVGVAPHPTF